LWTTSRQLLDDALGKHGLTGVEVDFIQKPFLPRVLALKVHEILDRTRGSDA
jgi:DNA-binding response OmpR family regulator